MKILITGGSGFIGSHYADAFFERGYEVTVFDRTPQAHEKRARFIQGDLLDAQAVAKAVRGSDFVIHAAGLLGTHETVSAALGTVHGNVIGSLNVLDAVSRYGNNLLNISKPNVWLNPYSITKDCIEKFCFMYAKEYRANIAILKLYNVYGPRQKYTGIQKAIPTWIVNTLRGNPVEVFGTGAATMDLVHVDDVCHGTVKIVEHFDKCQIQTTTDVAIDVYASFPNYNNQVLELGSGVEISVKSSITLLEQAMGQPLEVVHLAMRRGEIDGTRLRANITRLRELTDFHPQVNLDKGLNQTVDYYRRHLHLIDAGVL